MSSQKEIFLTTVISPFLCTLAFSSLSTIPERGGHTNFQYANVHVRPEVGNAVFFSYIDPATNMTDTGLTTHSGCPVFEGEKKIITQWVRFGVSTETPWDSFNTCKYLYYFWVCEKVLFGN